MSELNIKAAIEAILFASGSSVELQELQMHLKYPKNRQKSKFLR